MLSFIAEHSREDAPALVRPAGETLTFASLAMASAAVAQALEARVGDVAHRVVAIHAADGAQLAASLLAVLEAGGVAWPLDARLTLPAARAWAKAARAVALVVGDAAEDRLDVEPIDPSRLALPAEAALIVGRPDGPGTSSRSFAAAASPGQARAVFSRAAIAEAVDALVRDAQLSAATRTALLPLPASPLVVVGQVLATLRAGGTLVDVGQLQPRDQLRTLARLDGNTILATPPELDRLARAGLEHDAAQPPIARVMVQAPLLTPALRDDVQQAFPRATLVNLRRSADSLHFTTLPDPPPALPIETLELEGEIIDESTIEAELSRQGAREAAALRVADRRLGARLVAFVSGAGDFAAPPARVVTLDSLPRTPDGAIDRRALQRMASAE